MALIAFLALLLAFAPVPAAADPIITPLIVGIAATGGVTISTSVASFIGGLIVTGALAAASYLMRPDVPKPDDGTFSKKQSTPVRDYAMGRCRKSGPWLFGEATTGGEACAIYAIQDGWTDAIENVVLNNEVANIGEDDLVIPVDSIRYSQTTVQWRLGRASQTGYQFVEDRFPEIYNKDDARNDGITTVMVSASSPGAKFYQRVFPSGWPELSVIGRFGRFWDPRDVSQDPDDPSTWEWSENPIVLLLHYVCFHVHGYRRRWQEAYEPTSDMWIEAMNVCDERVPLSTGGDVARYAAGGYWDAITERKAVVTEILKSCDGWLAEGGDGSWIPFAGKYYPPDDDFKLNEDNILALSLQRGIPAEDRSKAIVVTFTSPDHIYAEVECDAWGENDLQDQGVPVERQAYPVPWVHDFTQARRLAKRESARVRATVRGVITADLSGLNVLRRRYVKLNWPAWGSTTDIAIEVRKVTISLAAGTVVIEFVKADPNIDAWDPETEEGARPPIPPPPNVAVNPTPPLPTLVRIGQKIQLTVPDVEEFPTVQLKAEYRRGVEPWEPMIVPDIEELVGYTDKLDDGVYEFRAAYLLGGYAGFWSPSAFYDFDADTVQPPKPLKTKGDLDTGNNWTVKLSQRAGDDPDNTRKLRFYRRPQGQTWDINTATLVDRQSARASDVRDYDDEPGVGDWAYDYVAENGSGVVSNRADDTRLVTVPPLADYDFANDTYSGPSLSISGGANGMVQNNAGVWSAGRRSNKGRLVEPTATNYFRNAAMAGAVTGSPGTVPTNWSMSASAGGLTRTIVGTGTEDGLDYIDVRYQGGAGNSFIIAPESAGFAATAGQQYVATIYAKLVGGAVTNLTMNRRFLTTPSNSTTGSSSFTLSGTASKLVFSRTIPTGDTAGRPQILSSSPTGAFDLTIRIYGVQVEDGLTATSPIRTTGAATVTRTADVVSVTLPARTTKVKYIFDDGSTQTVTASPGAYVVPTNLNRPQIARMVVM